jgi:hypothetical protein
MVNRDEHPHAGGAHGAASEPVAPESGEDDGESIGAGDIEIPLGVPVSAEEFARLKEEARRLDRTDEEPAAEQAQEDEG